MKTYDLYGTSEVHMDEVVARLSDALGANFVARDSGYRGGRYYRAGDLHDEHFVVLPNSTGDPENVAEPDFRDYAVLVEVNATLRSDTLRRILTEIPGLSLLRSTDV